MKKSEKLKELIKLYEAHIDTGNKILQRTFEITESPLIAKRRKKIPHQGEIEAQNMSFKFHGAGCTFEFDEVIVDFNYSHNFSYIGFDASRLYSFVESFLNKKNEVMQRTDFDESLHSLERGGALIKNDPYNSIDTHEYILKK